MKTAINYVAIAALTFTDVEKILIDKAIITTEFKNERSEIKPYWFKVNKQTVIEFTELQLKDLLKCLELYEFNRLAAGLVIKQKVTEVYTTLVNENEIFNLL